MAKQKVYAVKVTADSVETTIAEPSIIEAACQLAISVFRTCDKVSRVLVVDGDNNVLVNLVRS